MDRLKVSWAQWDQLIFELVASHLFSILKHWLKLGPEFVGCSKISLEILRQSILNASSSMLKYFDFSTAELGSVSVPMVTLYRPFNLSWITISAVYLKYFNGVRNRRVFSIPLRALLERNTGCTYNANTHFFLENTLNNNSNALDLICSSKELWYHVKIWFTTRSRS